ncbi:MAG: hemerythrin domain-containing protein [Burkholderiaceae bacterium]|nr:hemerythrin domain-containing protein [Burkholderiaceae bacterium]
MATDAPLLALAEVHGRLLRHCASLTRLHAMVAGGGADHAARTLAAELRREFDLATARLHRDEERALFPALLESMAGSDAVCIRQMVDARAEEHREIESRWLRLDQWLQAVEAGQTALPQPGTLEAFVALCQAHLEQEDGELLPMAERLLSDDALEEIAEAMQRGR